MTAPTLTVDSAGVVGRLHSRFVLPAEHFAVATVFLVGAAFGVVAQAPLLAAGAYPATSIVAVVHLLTLGWLTTSILGALYQFIPVAIGVPIASELVAHVSLSLHAPGLAAFAVGLVRGHVPVLLAGAMAMTLGLALFIVNLAVTLRRARERDVMWGALALAGAFLAVTLLIGGALGANYRLGFIGSAHAEALGTHLHVALVGWVMLVIVGVSQRMMPMFLLSHGGSDRLAQVAVALLGGGAAGLTLLHHVAVFGRWLPAALMLGGTVAFLAQVRDLYRRRLRKALDVGMRLGAWSLGGVALALPFAVVTAAELASPRMRTAYIALVLGSMATFVVAHFYKIVPFLVWNERFGPLAGKRPLPRVADLYSARWASLAGVLLLGGTGAVTVAILAGTVAGVRVGASLFAAGTLVTAAQMLGIARQSPGSDTISTSPIARKGAA